MKHLHSKEMLFCYVVVLFSLLGVVSNWEEESEWEAERHLHR